MHEDIAKCRVPVQCPQLFSKQLKSFNEKYDYHVAYEIEIRHNVITKVVVIISIYPVQN